MTPDEFAGLFDRARHAAFRFESLPAYDVGDDEAESIQAWRTGRPRPLRSVATDEFLAEVASTTLAGRRWDRVRVVDDPLTEYQRYQLPGYVETQAAGDHVWIIEREAAPDAPDFWLFDAGGSTACGVVLHYTSAGAPQRYELVDRDARLADLQRIREATLRGARSLNEYLAYRAEAGVG